MSVTDTLTISSRTAAIEEARRWAAAHLRSEGASDDAVWALELVLTEALANVIRHAYRGDETKRVELFLHVDLDLELELLHSGEPFDAETYTPPDLDAAPAGGYGLHLIDALMDEIEQTSTADRRTRLRLVKRRWKEHE